MYFSCFGHTLLEESLLLVHLLFCSKCTLLFDILIVVLLSNLTYTIDLLMSTAGKFLINTQHKAFRQEVFYLYLHIPYGFQCVGQILIFPESRFNTAPTILCTRD